MAHSEAIPATPDELTRLHSCGVGYTHPVYHPLTTPSMAPAPALTPEERARVDYYRAQFIAMGIDPDEPDATTDVTPAEDVAWLEGRAPCPWPR